MSNRTEQYNRCPVCRGQKADYEGTCLDCYEVFAQERDETDDGYLDFEDWIDINRYPNNE